MLNRSMLEQDSTISRRWTQVSGSNCRPLCNKKPESLLQVPLVGFVSSRRGCLVGPVWIQMAGRCKTNLCASRAASQCRAIRKLGGHSCEGFAAGLPPPIHSAGTSVMASLLPGATNCIGHDRDRPRQPSISLSRSWAS